MKFIGILRKFLKTDLNPAETLIMIIGLYKALYFLKVTY